jgi:N-acetylglucosaminyldiphosphoundecaprenol N-acetyl-beta-D-mannosaminyltransferase
MDPVLYRTFRDADLLLPDGIGIVAAVRLLYGLRLQRVPGSEFIFDICRLCARRGDGVFFYGAKEEVNRAAVEILAKRFDGLRIVGRSNGYVAEADMPALVDKINASGARVIFLALGSPMQERWLAKYAGKLESVRVCQGVGGTLDTIAGTVKRAPEFWCRMNLEWFYRLASQPSRIRRQRVLPVFAWQVVREAVWGKR